MQRRKLIGTLVVMPLIAVGAIASISGLRTSRLTHENLLRIDMGISRAELVAMLGPPGDYTTGPTGSPGPSTARNLVNAWKRHHLEIEPYLWLEDNAAVLVGFDADSDEIGCLLSWDNLTKARQSPLDNILWRAKRQWRKWFPE